MSFRLDNRAGSIELARPLAAAGLPVVVERLAAGDVEIVGRGPEGLPLLIGVEYKHPTDVLQCVRDGRFAEQLRAMKQAFAVSWLLIEGRLRGSTTLEIGRVERASHTTWSTPPGHHTYQEVAAWVLSMACKGGVLVWRTESREESVEWLRTLYLWATSAAWESHRATMAFYTPPLSATQRNPFEAETAEERENREKRERVMRVARELPHVGDGKLDLVADEFATVDEMIAAPAERWCAIKGFGKKSAAEIVEWIGRKPLTVSPMSLTLAHIVNVPSAVVAGASKVVDAA